MTKLRVLIVDDERLMRAGLRLLVDGHASIQVVGEAEDGEQGCRLVAELEPDVVLMDVRMPNCDGIEATRRIRASGSSSRVVMLTAFGDDGFVVGALRAGAVSFLLKDAPPGDVIAAIHQAAQGKPSFSDSILERLVRIAAAEPNALRDRDTSAATVPDSITDREWEVARLVADGLTNADIAGRLFLGLPTVKTHIGRLFDKLQVTNRVQLAIRVLALLDAADETDH